MKRILFPTDFSEVSNNAFIYALQMADHLQAEVIVLHTYELPYFQADGIPLNLMEVYTTLEEQHTHTFKKHLDELTDIAKQHELFHVPLRNVLKQGEVVWAINETVNTEAIDYVVMGTKGASGWKETFLGSTTGSVITDTNAYVLGIPENSIYQPIKNIVFTTKFREKDIKALQKVIEIADTFGAKIHCFYVKTSKSDVKETTIQDWKMLFSGKNVDFHIVENEHVKDTIMIFSELKQIDMIAMLTQNRGFFEDLFHQSLTQTMSYHAKVPILAIQESRL